MGLSCSCLRRPDHTERHIALREKRRERPAGDGFKHLNHDALVHQVKPAGHADVVADAAAIAGISKQKGQQQQQQPNKHLNGERYDAAVDNEYDAGSALAKDEEECLLFQLQALRDDIEALSLSIQPPMPLCAMPYATVIDMQAIVVAAMAAATDLLGQINAVQACVCGHGMLRCRAVERDVRAQRDSVDQVLQRCTELDLSLQQRQRQLQHQLEQDKNTAMVAEHGSTMAGNGDPMAEHGVGMVGDGVFSCGICMDDDVAVEDVFIVSDMCCHAVCRTCAAQHLRTQIEEKCLPLVCPICKAQRKSDGDFVAEISDIKAAEVLDEEDMTRKHDVALDIAIGRNANLVHCPKPGCSGVASMDDDDVKFVCPMPACGYEWCRACDVAWHARMRCKEYQQWLRDNGDEGERSNQALMQQRGYKKCECGTVIDKEAGTCNRVRCKGCNRNVCWLCLHVLPNDNTDAYKHFRAQGGDGTCKLWNERPS